MNSFLYTHVGVLQPHGLDLWPKAGLAETLAHYHRSAGFRDNGQDLSKITTKYNRHPPKGAVLSMDILEGSIDCFNQIFAHHGTFILDNDLCSSDNEGNNYRSRSHFTPRAGRHIK
ncbi:hypothetical protein [Parasitella parasitica]|uniref:Uncharacterized protein n=1 Tax=Parasitella parasitica TaxID=35722 RepID=A0A0B7N675_9FUNG|nr:hypothetical protein [Parasitella parasitica]